MFTLMWPHLLKFLSLSWSLYSNPGPWEWSHCPGPGLGTQVLVLVLGEKSSLTSLHVTTSWTSTSVPNFIAISLRWAYRQMCEILRFCGTFHRPVLSVLSCSGYTFFSQLRPGRTPGRILTADGLNDASSPKDVPFGGLDDDRNFKGFKPPKKPKKGAWLGNFPAKLAKL